IKGILWGRRMRESIGIDSVLGGWAMPKAYSEDMRARVLAEVESGASRRAAAEEFDVSASTAIIWVKCFRETGRCTAKPRGGSVSPLEKHADFATARPDPGRGGSGDAQAQDSWQPQRGVALLQASQRHFQKKACARRSRSARTWRERASAGCENRACLILPTWSSSTRLPPI